MKRLPLLLLVTILILPGLLFARNMDKTKFLTQPAYPVVEQERVIDPADVVPYDYQMDDTVLVGTSYYDFTNYGSLSQIIVLDDLGNVHFNWSNGLNLNAVNRHVYYNFYNTGTGLWTYPGTGIACLSSQRSGFSCMDVLPTDSRAVINCHSQAAANLGFYNATGTDFIYGFGAFNTAVSNEDSIYWPHIAVDINSEYQMISRLHPDAMPLGVDYTAMYYATSLDVGYTIEPFIFADTVNVPSFTVACSKQSERAAIGYHQFLGDYQNYGNWSGYLASQVNNDAYIIRRESGEDWDWDNPVNITKILTAERDYLPDSIQAQGDTLRAYLDIELAFDNDDVLHAMFTTRGLWEALSDTAVPPVTGLSEASFIWHWREDTDSLNVVAYGWWTAYDSVSSGVGAWKSTICRPQMGFDEDNNVYCVYELYPDGYDPLARDISATGYTNGEIFATVSTDGGYNWAEAINLTDTRSDGAQPGSCLSECFPGLAKRVDDYLHIFYMLDRDAGSYVFETETQSTQNPMYYLKLPKTEIPTMPWIDQFYFHVRYVPREPYNHINPVKDFTPSEFAFIGNYPNPFNPTTRFSFSLDRPLDVEMAIYDIQGRLVKELADDVFPAGKHMVEWNAADVSSGVYFCKLTAGGHSQTVKALLMK